VAAGLTLAKTLAAMFGAGAWFQIVQTHKQKKWKVD
jgi:hypothetical protein